MFRIISLILIYIFPFTDSVVAQERWPAKPVRWIVPYAAGGFGLKANNLQELIACAKANPGQLGFASSGIGGAHHLSGEMLRQRSATRSSPPPVKSQAARPSSSAT